MAGRISHTSGRTMPSPPIIFDFKKKTVTRAGDPAVEHAIREALEAQKGVIMTGPGTPQTSTSSR
jgi:hypothetical protein